jgi:hypothetical protein
MKKGMRERVSGGDVCDCCFGAPKTGHTHLWYDSYSRMKFQLADNVVGIENMMKNI